MKTIQCWCEEYTEKGTTGYCTSYMKPTWDSVVKQCQKDNLAYAGHFCYFECPYFDDHEGYMCGDEDPSITDIHKCPIFNDILNMALGGACAWEYEKFEE